MGSFSLEYCSNRASLLLHTVVSFLLSLVPSSLATSSRRPSRLSAEAIKNSLRALTYAEICHLSYDHDHREGTIPGLMTPKETSSSSSAAAAATCAVCLNELKREDMVRELRNCRHVFHRGCLDRWVDQDENGTCPLCRAPLVVESMKAVPAPPVEASWVVERLLYLFGDDLLVPPAALSSSPSSSFL